MKTIIAGSRSIRQQREVDLAVELSEFTISEVVSGTAGGVDSLGERWAETRGVPVKRFPAQWVGPNGYDRSAGFARNRKMAAYAEALIAVWDGTSNGTAHMIREAKKRGLQVFVYDKSLV